MAKYRKLPIIVDAEVYKKGMEDGYNSYSIGGQFLGYFPKGGAIPKANNYPVIKTPEFNLEISEGDYIITGVDGERWIVKPDKFAKTYEEVDIDDDYSEYSFNGLIDRIRDLEKDLADAEWEINNLEDEIDDLQCQIDDWED